MRSVWLLGCCACIAPHPVATVALPAPAPVRDVPPVPCVVANHHFVPDAPMPLVGASGAVFAEMTAADHVELTIAADPMLETSTFGLRLRTRAQSRFVPVFLRAHHVFRGVLSPGHETPLSWTPAEGRALSIAPRADSRFDWIGPPPADEVACSVLSLAAWSDDDDSTQGEPFGLEARAIPIAPAPGAPPVALVHGGSFNVLVQERAGNAVRIIGRMDDGALSGARVSGWVDDSALVPRLVATRVAGAAIAAVEATSDWTGCSADHPLFVELDGRVERAGAVLAGTRVAIEAPSSAGLVRVRVIGPSSREVPPPIRLVRGAAFVLARGDAEDCR